MSLSSKTSFICLSSLLLWAGVIYAALIIF